MNAFIKIAPPKGCVWDKKTEQTSLRSGSFLFHFIYVSNMNKKPLYQ